MTEQELRKESEIFDDLVCDILKPYGVAHSYIENIVSWHERGRDEAIKAAYNQAIEDMISFLSHPGLYRTVLEIIDYGKKLKK